MRYRDILVVSCGDDMVNVDTDLLQVGVVFNQSVWYVVGAILRDKVVLFKEAWLT
jgi:hypothetical protein